MLPGATRLLSIGFWATVRREIATVPLSFVIVLCLATLLNGSVGLAILARRVGRTIGWSRLLACAGALALLGVVEVGLLRWLGASRYGALHLLWLDLALVLPALGLGLLWARHAGAALGLGVGGFAWVAMAALPVGAYARFVEPYALRLERVPVALDAARAGVDPVRIGVLADVQSAGIGEHELQAARLLMAQRPDLILLPGDLFQGNGPAFHAALPGLRRFLARLSAPGGVWLVPGDSDGYPAFDAVVEGTEVTILRDEIVSVTVRDRRITLLGVDLATEGGPRLAEFEQRPGADDIRIVLAHRPRVVEGLAPHGRVDLLVAGHTHGGQVAFPMLGPLYTGSPLPRRVAAGGLHEWAGRRLYVSRGIGVRRGEAPPIRLGAPPEVSLLELR